MSLSEYELKRLRNIASNNAVLDALGLGDGESSLKPKPKPKQTVRKRPPDYDEPSRVHSTRRTNPPERFAELSDAFCLREEIETEDDRPRRTRKPVETYESEQARELEQVQTALLERRKAERHRAALSAQHEMQRQRAAQLAWQRQQVQQQLPPLQAPLFSAPTLQSVPSVAQYPRYPTKGIRYTCPRCNGMFVLKKDAKIAADGTVISGFRQHDCVATQSCIPVMC